MPDYVVRSDATVDCCPNEHTNKLQNVTKCMKSSVTQSMLWYVFCCTKSILSMLYRSFDTINVRLSDTAEKSSNT